MALSKIQTADMLDAPNLGRRNLIINGAMQVAQRGTTSSALTHNTNVYHSVDRWSAVTDQNDGSGTLTTTFSQSTDVPSTETFPYSLKAVVNNTSFTPSGTDCTALFSHSIETYNANPLGWGTAAAKQATLSYWIKSSVAGTGTLQIRLHDSSNVSGAGDGQFYTKFTINQANTWEKKTHLIPANTTDGWRRTVSENAMQLYWFFASEQAAVSTQDAWFRLNNYGQRHSDMTLDFQTTGGTAYLTGCQLEVGEQATDFEHRSFGEELALCQRYYQKSYDYGDAPGAVTQVGAIYNRYAATVSNQPTSFVFAVTMCKNPSMTIYSLNGTAGSISDCSTNLNHVADDVANVSGTVGMNGFAKLTGVGVTAGDIIGFHYTVDAEL